MNRDRILRIGWIFCVKSPMSDFSPGMNRTWSRAQHRAWRKPSACVVSMVNFAAAVEITG